MDNATLQRLKEALQRSKSVAVAVGKEPSIDEMAAALSLYLSLQAMGKNTAVLSATEPIVEVSNLVGVDKVKTRYEGGGADLVVSFPYREGDIEKVSYTIENGYLNIVVKAGDQGLTFSEQDVRYTRGNGELDLLFVVGTPRLADIHSAFSPDALKNVTLVNIDNKQENQGFGDIVIVNPRASSVSEQIVQVLNDLKAPLDVDIAQNLIDGISYGTENFQSPRTTPIAFEMAGILMRQGAVRSRTQQVPTTTQQMRQPQPQTQPQGNFQQQRPVVQQQPQQQSQQQRDNRDRRQFDQRQSDRNDNRDRRPQFDQRRQQQQPAQQNQQQSQPQQQPVQQRQPQLQQVTLPPQEQQNNFDDINPPTDWLTPKVYKGSSNV